MNELRCNSEKVRVKEVILSKDEKKLFENSKSFGKMSDLIMMLELIGRDEADFKIIM
ncbi:hypothetical protein [Clostridium sp.]|uniref:hypothetical protein n=1 Tax=Clostridium sp. TaxID=1506 RepID=UPI00284A2440|nr:hypothetical protein [Clostridium sp.]MDR3595537.1 hypothetical protein [Clostridium sp.]